MTAQTASTTAPGSPTRAQASRSWPQMLRSFAIYGLLTLMALVMVFPFIVMILTSLKVPADTFSYPPRLLPQEQLTTTMPDMEEPAPLSISISTACGGRWRWCKITSASAFSPTPTTRKSPTTCPSAR